tara:strand:+ start:128 stop:520 length:393 start_codon:yes stop_codon:yes gene_type:complete
MMKCATTVVYVLKRQDYARATVDFPVVMEQVEHLHLLLEPLEQWVIVVLKVQHQPDVLVVHHVLIKEHVVDHPILPVLVSMVICLVIALCVVARTDVRGGTNRLLQTLHMHLRNVLIVVCATVQMANVHA